MRIRNLSEDLLSIGWMTSNFSPGIKKGFEGLAETFFLKATFKLEHQAPASPWKGDPEPVSGDQWIDGDEGKGLGYASDYAPYKPHADFSAIGTAYPPPRATTHFIAKMRVGDVSRSVGVIGQREWKSGWDGLKRGDPLRVQPTQLSWNNAWGGPSSPMNPLGMGTDSKMLHLLVDPNHLVTSMDDPVPPAIFAPFPISAPVRSAKTGTYDQDWLEQRWPWLPIDFDYGYFNAPDQRQWLTGYLRGDETLEFSHMHPQIPAYKSRLPGLRVRCFVSQVTNWSVQLPPDQERSEFREVPMVLDTLWVDMDREKLILVWRGSTPVRSIKLRDIKDVLVLTEPLAEPERPLHHYHALLTQRYAPHPAEPETSSKPPNSPDEPKNPDIPDFDGKEVENLFSRDEQLDQEQRKILKFLDDNKAIFENFERLRTETSSISPPLEEQIQAIMGGLRSNPAIPRQFLDILENLKTSIPAIEEVASRDSNKEGEGAPRAEMPPPAPSDDLDAGEWAGRNLDGWDFSGRDLSGASLRGCSLIGANFSMAKLENADLQGSNLTGADLSGALLSGANLSNCDLSRCITMGTRWCGALLTGANLSRLSLKGADFSSCKADFAQFTRSDLEGTRFCAADLYCADFTDALLAKADLREARLSYAFLGGAKAPGVNMDHANLEHMRGSERGDFTGGSFRFTSAGCSVWENATLNGADFQQAELTGSRFCEASMKSVNMDRCVAVKCAFEDVQLQGALLTNANLLRSSFDRADLAGASLDGSNLYESGFWETNLEKASWKNANIRLTMLDR